MGKKERIEKLEKELKDQEIVLDLIKNRFDDRLGELEDMLQWMMSKIKIGENSVKELWEQEKLKRVR